jgi:hypothetical protein
MTETDRIIELLTQIRDELRESRDKTMKRYDDVIANSQKNDATYLAEWRAENQRTFEVWQENYQTYRDDTQKSAARWFGYATAMMALNILLAVTVLLLAWTRFGD